MARIAAPGYCYKLNYCSHNGGNQQREADCNLDKLESMGTRILYSP